MRKTSSSPSTSRTVRDSASTLARSRPNGFSTTTRAQPPLARSPFRPMGRTIGACAAGGVAR